MIFDYLCRQHIFSIRQRKTLSISTSSAYKCHLGAKRLNVTDAHNSPTEGDVFPIASSSDVFELSKWFIIVYS